MRRLGLLAVAALALGAADAPAPEGLTVDGHAEHALHLTLAQLKAMQQHELDISFETGHGPQGGHYAGVLLWDVVQQAGVVDAPGVNAKHHLQHVLCVRGRDGYVVAVALGEIDPDFEGKSVILGEDSEAGKIRLIVPGDKHGGRNVRDVVRIEIE